MPPDPAQFQIQPQSQGNWCWAAVAASISAFYQRRPVWSQCKLASEAHYPGQETCVCCGQEQAQADGCNRTYKIGKALGWTGALRQMVSETLEAPGWITFEECCAEIDDHRVIGIRIESLDKKTAHAMVIHGYDRPGERLLLMDPAASPDNSSHSYLVSGYNSSRWTHTYLTQG